MIAFSFCKFYLFDGQLLLVQIVSEVHTPQEGHLETSKFLGSITLGDFRFFERILNMKVIANNIIINVKILPIENIIVQTF